MARSGFHERLGYARWLRQLLVGGEDTDAALLKATGLKGPWLSKWKARSDAPTERPHVQALMRYFSGVVPEAWLIDNEGDPPRADLWSDWIKRNRRVAGASEQQLAGRVRGLSPQPEVEPRAPARPKRVAEGRKRS